MSNQILRAEMAHAIRGVYGRMFNVIGEPGASVVRNQKWLSESRPIAGYGKGAQLSVEMRFDDECRNGHNTFAITAEVRVPNRRDIEAGGCLHDDIARVFPELAPLIRWHLTSTDGPMHYEANTVYFAGDRDHNGMRAGEVRQIRNGRTGQPCWILEATATLPRYVDSEARPEETATLRYVPWTSTGEGKARELDKARNAAVWPEATDAELCVEPDALRLALRARLPALLAEFRAYMESAGFMWTE
mgnify:CR=1 FL=1